jgi:hypothetical protein
MSSWKAFGMDINKDLVGESSPNTTNQLSVPNIHAAFGR